MGNLCKKKRANAVVKEPIALVGTGGQENNMLSSTVGGVSFWFMGAAGNQPEATPLPSPRFFAIFSARYVVTFRSHNDNRPSKFIVLADNM